MNYTQVENEIEGQSPEEEWRDSWLQSDINQAFAEGGSPIIPVAGTGSGFPNDRTSASQQVSHGIMNDVPPIQFMDAINTGNSKMGNRVFLQFVKGLRQQLDIHDIAAKGVQGAGRTMTHLDTIQHAFGHHDVSGMREYTGRAAQESLATLGVEGFSSNGRMAFAGTPDLFTQAHEAAHGVQQTALGSGLQLKGGIGETGDKYECHADAVAEKVVRGESAQGLLDDMTSGIQTTVETTAHPGAVQFNGELINKFKNSKSRLILLDYDGTLVEFNDDPMKATPDDNLHEIIERLTQFENTKVVVITGRRKEDILGFLEEHEEVEFVAEHGMLRKRPGDKGWTATVDLDLSWKEEVRPIIQGYVDKVPGSYMEEKEYSLGWQYRPALNTAEADQAGKELETELTEYFKENDKDKEWLITNNNMVVEINTEGVDKGIVASTIAGEGKYDFIIAMGDGSTDEFMFKALPNEQTIKVGVGVTAARYRVNDVADARKLLKNLVA